jgi:DNA-directed RNA polymerase subunit RPC12/RpoP
MYRLRTWDGSCAMWHYKCHSCGAAWNVPVPGQAEPSHAPECPQCGSHKTRTISCRQAGMQCPTEAAVISRFAPRPGRSQ